MVDDLGQCDPESNGEEYDGWDGEENSNHDDDDSNINNNNNTGKC